MIVANLGSFLIGYWHQVRSYGAKNMAVTMLFSRIKSFNGSNCATKKVDFTPLSETGMVWTYPGYGPQTLGNLDPFELRYASAYCHFQCLCCTFVTARSCHRFFYWILQFNTIFQGTEHVAKGLIELANIWMMESDRQLHHHSLHILS